MTLPWLFPDSSKTLPWLFFDSSMIHDTFMTHSWQIHDTIGHLITHSWPRERESQRESKLWFEDRHTHREMTKWHTGLLAGAKYKRKV